MRIEDKHGWKQKTEIENVQPILVKKQMYDFLGAVFGNSIKRNVFLSSKIYMCFECKIMFKKILILSAKLSNLVV